MREYALNLWSTSIPFWWPKPCRIRAPLSALLVIPLIIIDVTLTGWRESNDSVLEAALSVSKYLYNLYSHFLLYVTMQRNLFCFLIQKSSMNSWKVDISYVKITEQECLQIISNSAFLWQNLVNKSSRCWVCTFVNLVAAKETARYNFFFFIQSEVSSYTFYSRLLSKLLVLIY